MTTDNATDALQEDQVKRRLEAFLLADGWVLKVANGHERGIDIDARKGSARWIEVKGGGSRPPMRVYYFLGAIGELLQHMDDLTARYSVAFPAIKQFQMLWTQPAEGRAGAARADDDSARGNSEGGAPPARASCLVQRHWRATDPKGVAGDHPPRFARGWSEGRRAYSAAHVLFASGDAGATAKAIQELAGHRDLATTRRYMHVSPAALDSAISAAGSASSRALRNWRHLRRRREL